MKLQKQDHLRSIGCMKCLRGTAYNKGGWFLCGCGASYIPSLDKWTEPDKKEEPAPKEDTPEQELNCSVAESTRVRRTLNREGFRETEKNADPEAHEIYKVANALDKSKMKALPHRRKTLIKARNKVTSEIFKHRYNPLPEGKELEMGKEEEKEHVTGGRFKELKKAVSTSPEKTAMTIAKQHLKDRPDYYSTLKKAGLAESGGDVSPHTKEERDRLQNWQKTQMTIGKGPGGRPRAKISQALRDMEEIHQSMTSIHSPAKVTIKIREAIEAIKSGVPVDEAISESWFKYSGAEKAGLHDWMSRNPMKGKKATPVGKHVAAMTQSLIKTTGQPVKITIKKKSDYDTAEGA